MLLVMETYSYYAHNAIEHWKNDVIFCQYFRILDKSLEGESRESNDNKEATIYFVFYGQDIPTLNKLSATQRKERISVMNTKMVIRISEAIKCSCH